MAVVVITGASSGIGEATAKALAARGHSLTLAARRLDRLQQLVRETGAADRILIVPADVAEPAALKAVADAAGERFGHIDVWINNAGVSYPDRTPWWELPAERVDNIVRVNFTAPILSVGAALPWLKKARLRRSSISAQYRALSPSKASIPRQNSAYAASPKRCGASLQPKASARRWYRRAMCVPN